MELLRHCHCDETIGLDANERQKPQVSGGIARRHADVVGRSRDGSMCECTPKLGVMFRVRVLESVMDVQQPGAQGRSDKRAHDKNAGDETHRMTHLTPWSAGLDHRARALMISGWASSAARRWSAKPLIVVAGGRRTARTVDPDGERLGGVELSRVAGDVAGDELWYFSTIGPSRCQSSHLSAMSPT